MAKQTKKESAKKRSRVKVGKLEKSTKELTREEKKKVRGGHILPFMEQGETNLPPPPPPPKK